MNENQSNFINILREEASDAKKCVTQYSFQCLALSASALGFIIGFVNNKNYLTSLAVVPIISLLMIMSRIAIYKYEIANRAYGYQFYLSKMLHFKDEQILWQTSEEIKSYQFLVKNEHWEQSFFVWRIICPTILRSCYKWAKIDTVFTLLDPYMYTLIEKDVNWFSVSYLVNQSVIIAPNGRKRSGASYAAGSYLANILRMLVIMQWLLLVPLLLAALLALSEDAVESAVLIITFVLMIMLVIIRMIRIHRRQNILENESLSIRTCSLIWETVIRVHYISWMNSISKSNEFPNSQDSLKFNLEEEYEKNLTHCAKLIRENITDPKKWDFESNLQSQSII